MKNNILFLAFVFCFVSLARAEFGDIAWSYQTGDVVTSSPIIDSAGNIYFGSRDGSVYSVDSSGEQRWSYATGDWVESSGALSSDESILYIGTWNDALLALNTENGELEWSYATESLVYASPAIEEDGTIYYGSSDGFLYALNPDGTLLWEYYHGSEFDSSPAVDELGNVYVGTTDGWLLAIDFEGDELWTLELDVVTDREFGVVSSPALTDDGVLYVGSSNYYIYSVDTFDGSINWQYETLDKVGASPVVGINDTVVCAGYDGYLYVLSDSGFLVWGAVVGDVFKSAAVVDALGRIYVASYAGQGINVMDVYSPEGIELWSTVFTDYIDSSPVLSPDGMLYVGSHDGSLYALEGGAGLSMGAWPRFRRDTVGHGNLSDYESPVLGREKLINISLRGKLEEGQFIIPGFVIVGPDQKSGLVRSVGPSLSTIVPQSEVDGLIEDPQVALYLMVDDLVALISSNDDWSSSENASDLESVSTRLGALDLIEGSKDSALLANIEAGVFSAVAQGVEGSEGVTLVELYDADEVDTSTRLVNVSMRGPVGVGANVMIAGFVIEGSKPKRLLLRGIGKGLESVFGLEGTLPDASMMLFSGVNMVAQNSTWDASPEVEQITAAGLAAGAFELIAEDSDAAMVVWLEPGVYTLWIFGENGESGTGLAEIYDLGD